MTYKLFLDDERDPPSDGSTWVVVRSVLAAQLRVVDFGCPVFISFDNDLGKEGLEYEGRGFAKWLIDKDFELATQGIKVFPDNFKWYAHTQNSVAKREIDCMLSTYFERKQSYLDRFKNR